MTSDYVYIFIKKTNNELTQEQKKLICNDNDSAEDAYKKIMSLLAGKSKIEEITNMTIKDPSYLNSMESYLSGLCRSQQQGGAELFGIDVEFDIEILLESSILIQP